MHPQEHAAQGRSLKTPPLHIPSTHWHTPFTCAGRSFDIQLCNPFQLEKYKSKLAEQVDTLR